MAKSQALTVNLRIEGVWRVLAAFRKLPKDADEALRRRSLELAEGLVGDIQAAALADSEQSALMAPTVRARKDRVPSIQAGGARRVGSQQRRSRGQGPTKAYMILFGSEFGAKTHRQFRPHLGQGSYWFFETVEGASSEISAKWHAAADDIQRGFLRDGD